MVTFLSIVGIVASLLILKFREQVGDMIGEAQWMQAVGGVYGVIIIASVLMFFFSVAAITGSLGFFLSPLRTLFLMQPTPPSDMLPQ